MFLLFLVHGMAGMLFSLESTQFKMRHICSVYTTGTWRALLKCQAGPATGSRETVVKLRTVKLVSS